LHVNRNIQTEILQQRRSQINRLNEAASPFVALAVGAALMTGTTAKSDAKDAISLLLSMNPSSHIQM
jgi:uncharacterized membrane protein YhiD involved in acid resistance